VPCLRARVAASLVVLSRDGCRLVRAGGRGQGPGRRSRRPEGVLDAGAREPIIGLGRGKWLAGFGSLLLSSGCPRFGCLPGAAVPLAAVIPSRGPGRGRGHGAGRVSRSGPGGANQVGVHAARGRGTDLCAVSRPAGAGALTRPRLVRAGSGSGRRAARSRPKSVAGGRRRPWRCCGPACRAGRRSRP
jgi:hypothetical protein